MANKKISGEEIEWLSKNKQSIEKRNRILKGAGVFFLYFAVFLALAPSVALTFVIFVFIIATAALVSLIFFISGIIPNSKYRVEAVVGVISGFTIGIAITLIYIIPMISISQYPISMQVFYPNHPNLTITQNCTDFTTSASSYINGQPMNPKNTTQCNLPPRITQNATEPFNCGIIGKKITCINAIFGVGNEVWQGTILNVSKR